MLLTNFQVPKRYIIHHIWALHLIYQVMKVGGRYLMFQKQLTLDQRVEFDRVLEGGWKGELYIHPRGEQRIKDG